jgi:hypothetical protein
MRLVDQEPRGEYPKQHSLTFTGDFNQITRNLRQRDKAKLTDTTLLSEYPFPSVAVDYLSYTYENSPFGDPRLPRRVSGYEINIHLPLRVPQLIDQETAGVMIASLQANTGMGEYRQLSNGKHQILIPGQPIGLTRDSMEWLRRRGRTTEGVSTLLELGYDDPDRGLKFAAELMRQSPPHWKEYIEKLRKQLQIVKSAPALDELRVRLKSDEVFREFIDKGDNNQIEESGRNIPVEEEAVHLFFERAALVIEAVSDTLGQRPRRSQEIPLLVTPTKPTPHLSIVK